MGLFHTLWVNYNLEAIKIRTNLVSLSHLTENSARFCTFHTQ